MPTDQLRAYPRIASLARALLLGVSNQLSRRANPVARRSAHHHRSSISKPPRQDLSFCCGAAHSRVRQLVDEGRFRAKIVLDLIRHAGPRVLPSGLLRCNASHQSGGLRARGIDNCFGLEPHWSQTFREGTNTILGVTQCRSLLLFLFLTTLHVVLGELVPKAMSLQARERVASLVAPPFQWYPTRSVSSRLVRGWSQQWNPRGWDSSSGLTSHTQVHTPRRICRFYSTGVRTRPVGMEEDSFILGAIRTRSNACAGVDGAAPRRSFVAADATLDDVLPSSLRQQLPATRVRRHGRTMLGYIHIKDMVWVLLEPRARRKKMDRSRVQCGGACYINCHVPESKP